MIKSTSTKFIIDVVEPYDGHYRLVWKHTFDDLSEALQVFDQFKFNQNCIAASLIEWKSDVKNALLTTGNFKERSNESFPIQKIIIHGSRTYIKKDGKDFNTMDDWEAIFVDWVRNRIQMLTRSHFMCSPILIDDAHPKMCIIS